MRANVWVEVCPRVPGKRKNETTVERGWSSNEESRSSVMHFGDRHALELAGIGPGNYRQYPRKDFGCERGSGVECQRDRDAVGNRARALGTERRPRRFQLFGTTNRALPGERGGQGLPKICADRNYAGRQPDRSGLDAAYRWHGDAADRGTRRRAVDRRYGNEFGQDRGRARGLGLAAEWAEFLATGFVATGRGADYA